MLVGCYIERILVALVCSAAVWAIAISATNWLLACSLAAVLGLYHGKNVLRECTQRHWHQLQLRTGLAALLTTCPLPGLLLQMPQTGTLHVYRSANPQHLLVQERSTAYLQDAAVPVLPQQLSTISWVGCVKEACLDCTLPYAL